MGFTIINFSLLGLQNQNWYVTIKGSYQVRKIESLMPGSAQGGVGDNSAGLNVPSLVTPYYTITFSVYFKASQNSPVINDQYMSFNIQALPNPAVLYKIIYDFVKGQLAQNPEGQRSSAGSVGADPQQTLIFTDD